MSYGGRGPQGPKPSARPSGGQAGAAAGGPGKVKPSSSSGNAKPAAERASLRVFTRAEKDDVGIETLVGDYVDRGANHGRRFYEKMQPIEDHEDMKVFLYYWDTRDGADFSGWWFGDRVGGTQVWSKAESASQTPPYEGWKVPWDGDVVPNLLLVQPLAAAGGSSSSTGKPQEAGKAGKSAPPSSASAGKAPQQAEAPPARASWKASPGGKAPAGGKAAAADKAQVGGKAPPPFSAPGAPVKMKGGGKAVADEADGTGGKGEATFKGAHSNPFVGRAKGKDASVPPSPGPEPKGAGGKGDGKGGKAAAKDDGKSGKAAANDHGKGGKNLAREDSKGARPAAQEAGNKGGKIPGKGAPMEGAGKAAAAGKPSIAKPPKLHPLVKEHTLQCDALDTDCEERIKTAKNIIEESAQEDMEGRLEFLKEAEEIIKGAVQSVAASLKELGQAIQGCKTEDEAKAVPGLEQLSKRLRGLRGKLEAEAKIPRDEREKLQKDQDDRRRKAEAEFKKAEEAEQEQRRAQELKSQLLDMAAQAEDAVETTAIMASAIVENEEDPAVMAESLQGVDQSAAKASELLDELGKQAKKRKEEALKFQQTKLRREALKQVEDLKKALAEASKKLAPLKNKRQEYQRKHEARKVVADFGEKLGLVELEVEKAALMTGGASQLSEGEVKNLDKALDGASKTLQDLYMDVQKKSKEERSRYAQKEFEELIKRVKAGREKLDEAKKAVKAQKEGIMVQQVLTEANAKVCAVEDALNACNEAEMPFLSGLEVLPADEALPACDVCEKEIGKADEVLATTTVFLRQKSSDVRAKCSRSVAEPALEDLAQLQRRAEEVGTKLKTLKKETVKRRSQALLIEAMERLSEMDTSVAALKEAAKAIDTPKLAEASIEDIKTACSKLEEAGKAASACCEAARKEVEAKKKSSREQALLSELSSLDQRINTAAQEPKQAQRAIDAAQKAIRDKQVLAEELDILEEVEKAVDEVVTKAAPLNEQDKVEEEVMVEIEAAVKAAQGGFIRLKGLSPSSKGPQVISSIGPFIKGKLSELVTRAKTAQEKLDAILKATRAQREKRSAETILQKAEELVKAADTSLEKVAEVEAPFVKGLESMPLAELKSGLGKCEEALSAISKACMDAQDNLKESMAQARKFQDKVQETTATELKKLMVTMDKLSKRWTAFRKETDERQRDATAQEAAELLDIAEAQLKKTEEVSAQLNIAPEALEKLTPDEGAKICKRFADSQKVDQEKMEKCKKIFNVMDKDFRGFNKSLEELKKLKQRWQTLTDEQARLKKVCTEGEQQFVTVQILRQAKEKFAAADAEWQKVTTQAAPLLEDKAALLLRDFEAAELGTAIRAWAKKQTKTEEEVCKKLVADSADGLPEGKKTDGEELCSKAAFLAFVADMQPPEPAAGEEDSKEEAEGRQFTKEDAELIFDHLDTDKDGCLARKEFEMFFRERYACVKATTMTDKIEIQGSKTVAKLAEHDVVEAIGDVTQAAQGLSRRECKLVEHSTSAGTAGWITLKGNQGTIFLEPLDPQVRLKRQLQTQMDASRKKMKDALAYMSKQISEMGASKSGPLSKGREDLKKIHGKADQAKDKYDDLESRIAKANKAFLTRLADMKQAREDAKHEKIANKMLEDAHAKATALRETYKGVETTLAPLQDGKLIDTKKAVVGPVTLVEEAEKVVAGKLSEELAALRAAIEEKMTSVSKAAKGPLHKAKTTLEQLRTEASNIDKGSDKQLKTAREACARLGEGLLSTAVDALRAHLRSAGTSAEACFDELAEQPADATENSQPRLPVAKLSKRMQEVPDLKLTVDEVKLACARLEALGGTVSRVQFLQKLQVYYKCVRPITLTNTLDIKTSKALRQVQVGEVLEEVDGATGESNSGVNRIRARAVTDGVTGWISLKGNQGTAFLEACEKPFMVCTQDMQLHSELRSGADAPPKRAVKAEEVLEVRSGPKEDTQRPIRRLRVKACRDGASGWFTCEDSDGQRYAEASKKIYVVTQTIALTNVEDIKVSKVLRKLEPKETIEALDDAPQGAGLTRVRAKTSKDGLVGWITIKGTAGTIYCEESSNFHTMLRASTLQKKFKSSECTAPDSSIRALEEGEVVEVLEGPKKEEFQGRKRLEVRCLSDGAAGWVTVEGTSLKPWSSRYKCAAGTVIQDRQAVRQSSTRRRLEAGEIVDVLDGPVPDPETGVMRVCARTQKDKLDGWVTIRGNKGTTFLANVAPK
eukprot:TRINITY_DN5251_c0_g1_i1.p1 TRINITY_DN5251_c0_g1~~TRINITY_DN5251_c0_g1_i1.p1  ORF type:complete len:2225 (-),score=881.17 TRINITY_DN5251_c0_g1_i1:74-6748(-)